jgi:hypothetical protein
MNTAKTRLSLLLVAALLVPASLLAVSPAGSERPAPDRELLNVGQAAACGEQGAAAAVPGEEGAQTPALPLETPFSQSQAMNSCSLEDCADRCNETCQPNGGIPWTCQWYDRPGGGGCSGICWCY